MLIEQNLRLKRLAAQLFSISLMIPFFHKFEHKSTEVFHRLATQRKLTQVHQDAFVYA